MYKFDLNDITFLTTIMKDLNEIQGKKFFFNITYSSGNYAPGRVLTIRAEPRHKLKQDERSRLQEFFKKMITLKNEARSPDGVNYITHRAFNKNNGDVFEFNPYDIDEFKSYLKLIIEI